MTTKLSLLTRAAALSALLAAGGALPAFAQSNTPASPAPTAAAPSAAAPAPQAEHSTVHKAVKATKATKETKSKKHTAAIREHNKAEGAVKSEAVKP